MEKFSNMFTAMEGRQINEGAKGTIKPHVAFGMLNANRKAASAAANASQSVKLVKLNKDGKESGMHDASSYYKSEGDAGAKVAYWGSINPGKEMKYQLYVDGKPVRVISTSDAAV